LHHQYTEIAFEQGNQSQLFEGGAQQVHRANTLARSKGCLMRGALVAGGTASSA
jgi:hypothetical protein